MKVVVKVVSETRKNGEFSADYPSGRPEWVGRYAHGRLDGPYTAWHDAASGPSKPKPQRVDPEDGRPWTHPNCRPALETPCAENCATSP